MKDYYKILQVSRHASVEEIKKSYRRLALMYHPDRNSDPSAAGIIKELNEAYEVLGDDLKRNNYNYRYDNKDAYKTTKTYTYTAKAKKPASQGKYYVKKEKYDFSAWAQIARIVSAFIVFYCGLLSLDFILSADYEEVIAEHVTGIKHKSGKRVDYVTNNIISEKINFSFSSASSISPGDKLNFQITPFFGIVRNCKVFTNGDYFPIEIINIYSPIFFVVIVALITGLNSLFSKSHEKSLTLSITSFFFFLITLYMVSQS